MNQSSPGRWSAEKIRDWYNRQPPIRGYNYLPRTAVNSTEMWQAEGFDLPTIAQELRWAGDAGYNACRVFLQYLVWEADSDGTKDRIRQFLSTAAQYRQRVMFVLFDDCAFSGRDPYLGPQETPVPGVHNSGWTPSPGRSRVTDPACRPHLQQYVQDLIGTFALDRRILAWDLYNEPGNSEMRESSLPLAEASFAWAREAEPEQPLTTGIWTAYEGAMSRRIVELSDIVSFHCYTPPDGMARIIGLCQEHGRPILCTEWLLRQNGNTFEAMLPIFADARVGWYHWGLVAGKTQTFMPWGSKPGDPAPAVWQHDVFHQDGSPYQAKEMELLKLWSS